MDNLRTDLPPVPWRIKHRPVHRGYPVPWFVATVDGVPDFRIADPQRFVQAIRERRCWLCGIQLGRNLAFVVGPMCTITRTTSEPPSHTECAEWAVRACPFLTQQTHGYRTAGLPEQAVPPAGEPIFRQAGASAIWITRSYRPFKVDNGVLITMGDPTSVSWWREGRHATRAEVLESIESGYPNLLTLAEQDGPDAVRDLAGLRERAAAYLPA